MKLGIYCDSAINGGHEEMLKNIARVVAAAPRAAPIEVFVSAENAALLAFFRSLGAGSGAPRVLALPYSGESLRRRPLATAAAALRLAMTLRSRALDELIVAQGTIVSGIAGILACRLSRTAAVSYIPLIEDEGAVPATGMASFKAWVKRLFYRLPRRYITLDTFLADQLKQRAPRCEIDVIENYWGDARCLSDDAPARDAARRQLAVPDNMRVVVSHVARVHFKHKRQDFLLDCIQRHPEIFGDFLFLIAGEGPDLEKARERVRGDAFLSEHVRLVGHRRDVATIIAASDLLVLPSAYEGVPLIMLEAILLGRPIVAANVSGLSHYLPADLLFASGSEEDFVRKMRLAARFPVDELRQAFQKRFSRGRFETEVARACRLV